MYTILTCLLAVGSALAAPGPSNKISSDLQSRLQDGQQANIIVSFAAGTSSVLQNINSATFDDRDQRLNALHDALVRNAESSQQGVLNLLKSMSNVEFKTFWISNQVFVKNADLALVQSIAQDPQVSSVDEEIIAHLIEPVEKKEATLEDDLQWGVVKIQAPEAWKELGARNGNGVVIATLDTGVRESHEALRHNFVGDYGWFDPSTAEPRPTDRNGHGTHTTGTIAGSKGIGVAPGAKWAACRGCATSSCFQSDLLACGQFFACPTLADGSKPDCSKAPHLVSNSWGGGRGNTWFNGVIEAWHAAKIIPLFSIGNSGPFCNTANSPGDQNVIGVGSTTSTDAISSFSSVGPTSDGRMKPEIAAPGSDVISAYHTADNAYVSLSGTSMACPHAAGTIALLQTRNKNLTYEQAKDLLLGNTDQNLAFSGRVCDGVGDNVFPNHVFGSGRINALKSIKAQTKTMQN